MEDEEHRKLQLPMLSQHCLPTPTRGASPLICLGTAGKACENLELLRRKGQDRSLDPVASSVAIASATESCITMSRCNGNCT
jgi:hypothetical protein